jgi:putative DNA methylase
MTSRRLIEETFPLKKVSEDSKHEKNVRHGHISTLHIWPARRPLAASRAAIIAALMPDPGDEEGRRELNTKIESLTRWGTENGPALDFFRKEIRMAYGGRAPRVLDMFAGGGAIPLEAMRLGCDVTAIDYNPVAWFILKCTLEFPQKLAGKTWPLPGEHNGENKETDKTNEPQQMSMLAEGKGQPGTLAEHVRYWGNWVVEQARTELEPYYPVVDGKPIVAYLWARTVPCPDPVCGAEIPLLKTFWLTTKEEKTLPDTPENRSRPDFLRVTKTRNTSRVIINARRALRLIPNQDEHHVDFEIWVPGPKDEVMEGTMARAKSRCPVCGVALTSDYIKECGNAGTLGARMTTVVYEGEHGKEYRLPTRTEEIANKRASEDLAEIAAQIPFGVPNEPLPGKHRHRAVGSQLPDYGFKTWGDIFTKRQLIALSTFVKWTRLASQKIRQEGYSDDWAEALSGYLAIFIDRIADRGGSSLSHWDIGAEGVVSTYNRFALAMNWDFSEAQPYSNAGGGYQWQIDWVTRFIYHATTSLDHCQSPVILNQSATKITTNSIFDAIITDPPYYDSIPYADLSDFYYVWLKRTLGDVYPNIFISELTPKTDELVQQVKTGDIGREGKANYEAGMTMAFANACKSLSQSGYMVVVFAHKEPDAWETLMSALIRAGFVVTASWPIDTEMQGGMRSKVASLASSIWLVCRKRSEKDGVGRYAAVKKAMQERITERLRYFWDMGISGPDFVWAAVGPALESYSAYDEVRRMDGSAFTVGEFLREVRRMVADFALGQILKGQSTEGLDEWSRYYLIHRNLFGLADAPVGECILLSQGYGLDLNDLRSPRGIMLKLGSGDVRLAKWDERKRDDLGEPHPSGGLPLIDMLHRLTWLWASGETAKLRAYSDDHGIGRNELFWAVAQAILEMAETKSRERQLLEALVAWGRGRFTPVAEQPNLLK